MMLKTGISPAEASGGESIGRGVSVCPGVEGDFVSEGGSEMQRKPKNVLDRKACGSLPLVADVVFFHLSQGGGSNGERKTLDL